MSRIQLTSFIRVNVPSYSRFILLVANKDTWNVNRKSQTEIDGFIQRMGYKETATIESNLKAYVRTWSDITWIRRHGLTAYPPGDPHLFLKGV